MQFKKGTALTEEQVYERLQVLKKSLDANLRRKARHELLESNHRVLNVALAKIIKMEDDTELLAYAAELTVETSGEEGAARILSLLHSPEPLLRRHVCGLLSNCGGEHSTIPLIGVLKNDVSADVRVVAAFALKKVGDERALPALRWAKEHDEGEDYEGRRVSDEAEEAIAKIKRRKSILLRTIFGLKGLLPALIILVLLALYVGSRHYSPWARDVECTSPAILSRIQKSSCG